MRSTVSIIAVWLAVGALVFWAFSQFFATQYTPKMSISQQGNEVVSDRARDGHYRLNGAINGEPVVLLLDTGATTMAISEALAERLNLTRGESFITQTANGEVTAYQANLQQLDFGPFSFQHVNVAVVPRLGEEILLGMNIIRQFNIRIEGEQMHLQLIAKAN